MSIARQFGLMGNTPKKAADKPTTAKEEEQQVQKERPSLGFVSDSSPTVEVELKGEMKAWGVRIDKAVLDLVRRNSKNQTREAEEMILMYASKMGWK